jgi:hypothetical protein
MAGFREGFQDFLLMERLALSDALEARFLPSAAQLLSLLEICDGAGPGLGRSS